MTDITSLLEFCVPPILIEYLAPAPAVTFDEPAPVIDHVAPDPAVNHAAPAPAIEYVAPATAVTYTAPSPVIDHVAPTPAVTFDEPAPVIENVAPSPVIEYIGPPLAVICSTPSQLSLPACTVAAVTNGVNLDTTGLVNPQCSITAVEASARHVVGSFPPLNSSLLRRRPRN